MSIRLEPYTQTAMSAIFSLVVFMGLAASTGCPAMTEYTNGSATLNMDIVGSDGLNLIAVKGIDEEEGDEFTMMLSGLNRDGKNSEIRLSSAELGLGPFLPNIVSLGDMFESDIAIRFIIRDTGNVVDVASCTVADGGVSTDCMTTFSTARDLGNADNDIESIFDGTFDVEISGTRTASFGPDDAANLQLVLGFTHLYRD